MNSNNNIPPMTIRGLPNISNTRTVACLLDLIGGNLTPIFNQILNDPNNGLNRNQRGTLIAVHMTLKEMRKACVDADPSCADDLAHLTSVMHEECRQYEEQLDRDILANAEALRDQVRDIGIDIREFDNMIGEIQNRVGVEKPSASDLADEILRDLRESGTIGGARAV